MNTKAIIAAAKRYSADEHEILFASEISKLVQENNITELEDRFYQSLSFGTGGLRGKIGGGSNRMNPLVVGRSTKGFGLYLQSYYKQKDIRVAICYDSRRHSRYFSRLAACVLAELGAQVYLFSHPRPTPLLSFAVRDQACHAGIMITASHNPPEYNGYKVYWNDGAQIVEPHDGSIEESIATLEGPVFDKRAIQNNLDYLYTRLEEYRDCNAVVYSDPSIDERFLQTAIGERRNRGLTLKDVSIAYTPLHGVGGSLIQPAAEALHLKLHCEAEQSIPDSEFSTVVSPNPEDSRSLQRVIELCNSRRCDVLIATDPDADRIGVGVHIDSGIELIDGNQLGALVIDYLLAHTERSDDPLIVVNTIVTSDLQSRIIAFYGAEQKQTLTGFKHIAGVIRSLNEENKLSRFLLGTEESFGLLIGTHVWDKDSITAAIIVCEMVAYYKKKNMTIYDRLIQLYERYGYYQEKTYSFVFEGSEGMQKIASIMDSTRKNMQVSVGDYAVVRRIDFLRQCVEIPGEASEAFTQTPPSNVLKWYLKDFGWVCLRPSGTEPKIKLYYSYTQPFTTLPQAQADADVAIQILHRHFKEWF